MRPLLNMVSNWGFLTCLGMVLNLCPVLIAECDIDLAAVKNLSIHKYITKTPYNFPLLRTKAQLAADELGCCRRVLINPLGCMFEKVDFATVAKFFALLSLVPLTTNGSDKSATCSFYRTLLVRPT